MQSIVDLMELLAELQIPNDKRDKSEIDQGPVVQN